MMSDLNMTGHRMTHEATLTHDRASASDRLPPDVGAPDATDIAILDAATRFYGQLIAQGGLPALLQVADKLAGVVGKAQLASAPAGSQ